MEQNSVELTTFIVPGIGAYAWKYMFRLQGAHLIRIHEDGSRRDGGKRPSVLPGQFRYRAW